MVKDNGIADDTLVFHHKVDFDTGDSKYGFTWMQDNKKMCILKCSWDKQTGEDIPDEDCIKYLISEYKESKEKQNG